MGSADTLLILMTIFVFVTETEDWTTLKERDTEAEPLNI